MKQKASTFKMISQRVSKLIFCLIVASLAMIFIEVPGAASVLAVKILLHEGNKVDMS